MTGLLSLPECGCSERSDEFRTFTCPVCIRAALRYWDGEGVDQTEMFAQVDSTRSMSAPRSRAELTPIADVLRSLGPSYGAEDLPF